MPINQTVLRTVGSQWGNSVRRPSSIPNPHRLIKYPSARGVQPCGRRPFQLSNVSPTFLRLYADMYFKTSISPILSQTHTRLGRFVTPRLHGGVYIALLWPHNGLVYQHPPRDATDSVPFSAWIIETHRDRSFLCVFLNEKISLIIVLQSFLLPFRYMIETLSTPPHTRGTRSYRKLQKPFFPSTKRFPKKKTNIDGVILIDRLRKLRKLPAGKIDSFLFIYPTPRGSKKNTFKFTSFIYEY